MKKVLAVLVALGVCSMFWFGCQKKEGAPAGAPPAPAVKQMAPTMPPPPPPPPPPAPAAPAGEEKKAE
jgi:hypothetical protein